MIAIALLATFPIGGVGPGEWIVLLLVVLFARHLSKQKQPPSRR